MSDRSVVMTSVGAASARICASGGRRSVVSRTIRRGEAPGTRRTVSWGSSARTVPTPTSTASHAARRACDVRRSASLLIHFESPVRVAMRPSRVCAYFRTTYGRASVTDTAPSSALRSETSGIPSVSPSPAGAVCCMRDSFVFRYARLRTCAEVGRRTRSSIAAPARRRPSALWGLFVSNRSDRTPSTARQAAVSV